MRKPPPRRTRAHLRPGVLELFLKPGTNPAWRTRDGKPHQTQIACAAGIAPSQMSVTVRGITGAGPQFRRRLTALAVAHLGMTDGEASAALFEPVPAPTPPPTAKSATATALGGAA